MARITIGRVLDSSTDSVRSDQGVPASDADSWPVRSLNQLVTDPYDAIDLTYTGSNLTQVEYFQGGIGGTLVATLTLSYTGTRLDSVVKS